MPQSNWAIAEIVRAIATILASSGAKASAVALASCCKSLEEPAIGEVWRSLSNLTPLVSCFPPDAWEVKDKLLFFKRAPLPKEWTRFQNWYAPKVRHLTLTPDIDISRIALHLLHNLCDGSPLLPNLVSLEWESGEEFVPFVPSFISRSLTSINILSLTAGGAAMLPPILTKLSTLPYLRNVCVDVDGDYPDSSVTEASSQLLMQFHPHRLRQYNVDTPISASVLRHVMQLPSLEEFLLNSSSQVYRHPDPLPTVVFPSLRILEVRHKDGDHSWLNLIHAIANPVLSDIRVWCPGSDVVQFMETFQLTMTGCGIHEGLKEFDLWIPDVFSITPHIIACTFPFENLTTLHVMSSCSDDICQLSDLADGDIDLLTKALPYLESLKLGGPPCETASMITFKSLYTLSHRCTRLKTLEIHFDPTSFGTEVTNAQAGDITLGLLPSSELCSVRTINIGRISWPNETPLVVFALGLLGVFPQLENVEYDEGFEWEELDEMINILRRMGRFEIGLGLVAGNLGK